MVENEQVSGDDPQKQFGRSLSEALRVRGMTQADLAKALETTQSAVSAWVTGKSEPIAESVFKMEQQLDISPGGLSRILNYLPLEAATLRPGVEECIQAHPFASDDSKRMMIAVWRTILEKDKRLLSLTNAANGPVGVNGASKNGAATKPRPPRSRPQARR